MYNIPSFVIAGALFMAMAFAIEVGYRLGVRSDATASQSLKDHIGAVSGSLIGILALLLGFTFSLSLQRFDSRSEAVVAEANAIGTAYMRINLIPSSLHQDVRAAMREYLDLRIRDSRLSTAEHDARAALLASTYDVQARLWSYATRAAELDEHPAMTSLFIQALNESFDALAARNASLARHVPELVLMLLFATFLMTGAIVGYASGVRGHRASFVTHVMVALIVVLVFIILDLDRPRRGLIVVSQQSLIELQSNMKRGAEEVSSAHATP